MKIGTRTDVVFSPERLRELTRSSAETLSASYERMVTAEPAAEYGRLYKRIAAGDLPVIAHCTAGKDRTGVFSAILLTAVYTMHAEVLTNTFATIDRLYGSFDGFVRDGLKLTPSEVASLRTQLLE
jgi:protein-tyrosine phosphatase